MQYMVLSVMCFSLHRAGSCSSRVGALVGPGLLQSTTLLLNCCTRAKDVEKRDQSILFTPPLLAAQGQASSDHTTLLLNCYTKAKDVEKLDRFIQAGAGEGGAEGGGGLPRRGDLPFDVDTAIKVCAGPVWCGVRAGGGGWGWRWGCWAAGGCHVTWTLRSRCV